MLHLKELLGVRDGFQKRRDSGLSVSAELFCVMSEMQNLQKKKEIAKIRYFNKYVHG